MSQLGPPSFSLMELNTRLRPHNDMISYPTCIYEEASADVSVPTQVTNFCRGNSETQTDRSGGFEGVDSSSGMNEETDFVDDEEEEASDEASITLTREVLDLLDDDKESEPPDGVGDGEIRPTQAEVEMASSSDKEEGVGRCLPLYGWSKTPNAPRIQGTIFSLPQSCNVPHE